MAIAELITFSMAAALISPVMDASKVGVIVRFEACARAPARTSKMHAGSAVRITHSTAAILLLLIRPGIWGHSSDRHETTLPGGSEFCGEPLFIPFPRLGNVSSPVPRE